MHDPVIPVHPHEEDLVRVTALFRALSEPVRLRLLLQLRGAGRSVNELVNALNLPQSTVSRHLALLRAADLVRGERHGPSVTYHLADSHVATLVSEAFSHARHERLGLPEQALSAALRTPRGRKPRSA